MELTADTAEAYLAHAYRQILAVVDRLGDERLNRRPHGSHTNPVGGLVAHCLGVTEFWLGHVALGRPSTRDRDAEFGTELTVAEAHEQVDAALRRVADDLERIAGGEAHPAHPWAETLAGGAGPTSVVLHVLEEVFQHLGQMELTADALLPS